MRTKLLSAILCFCMLGTFLPATASAGETYEVAINGTNFSSAEKEIVCGEGKATLDTKTTPYTLTLSNATIIGNGSLLFGCINSKIPLRIVLSGKNVIDDAGNYGLYLRSDNGGSTIESASGTESDSLSITSKGSAISIWGENNSLKLKSGTVNAAGGEGSCGIYDNNGVCPVTVSGGKLKDIKSHIRLHYVALCRCNKYVYA